MDIIAKYNGSSEAAHADIDDDRYDMAGWSAADQPELDLTDQLQGCKAIVMATSEKYDMAEWGAAGQPKLDLSDQLRGCSICSSCSINLSNAIMLYGYHHQV